jgi:hypothetical protein
MCDKEAANLPMQQLRFIEYIVIAETVALRLVPSVLLLPWVAGAGEPYPSCPADLLFHAPLFFRRLI